MDSRRDGYIKRNCQASSRGCANQTTAKSISISHRIQCARYNRGRIWMMFYDTTPTSPRTVSDSNPCFRPPALLSLLLDVNGKDMFYILRVLSFFFPSFFSLCLVRFYRINSLGQWQWQWEFGFMNTIVREILL